MRREWRAVGRGVAQVREGAETSPQRVGAAWAPCVGNVGAARDREGGARKWQGTLRKKCGCSPRGEWGSEEWRGQLAEMNVKFAPRRPKRGIKIASERHNRRRCHAPHSPPCESRSHREAEGWEWAHRASRGCGGNARKRSAGADPPDRRPAFRRNGSRRRRGRTSLVPCRPRHGAPNGARRRWRGRETPCCAPSCPTALRSRRAKGRNLRRATRAIPAAVRRWDECRGATVFLLRGWTWASGVRNCEKAPSGEHAVGGTSEHFREGVHAAGRAGGVVGRTGACRRRSGCMPPEERVHAVGRAGARRGD